MIGVFVKPGVVPAATDKALARFNRSFEYDGLGPEYARFLLEEILPAVETRKTADGRPLVLSKNGNDRSIGGTSSGAIAAFTAAWERPDAFSRVYSGIGTYVGLRGGHAYSTLVRKFEPKPLRIFLEDGSNDLNIYAGDWWMANQAMQRSLAFAGYDSRHAWGDGGHNNKQATELFPEAFAWLWGEWPQPIAKGAGSPQLQEILIPGEDWRLVGEGYRFTEGPTGRRTSGSPIRTAETDRISTRMAGSWRQAAAMSRSSPGTRLGSRQSLRRAGGATMSSSTPREWSTSPSRAGMGSHPARFTASSLPAAARTPTPSSIPD
jgi:hypothetical protein